MDSRRVEDLLIRIESDTRRVDDRDASLRTLTDSIRQAVTEIRKELTPPKEDNEPRTRDQISPREWAEYEWIDATTFGDKQRRYIRGLKR